MKAIVLTDQAGGKARMELVELPEPSVAAKSSNATLPNLGASK